MTTPSLSRPQLVWLHSHFLYWMGGTKYIFEIIKKLAPQFEITVIVENASPEAEELYQKNRSPPPQS